jgi:hypothetical protein
VAVLCPPGWQAWPRFGDEMIATAPDEDSARELRLALRRRSGDGAG